MIYKKEYELIFLFLFRVISRQSDHSTFYELYLYTNLCRKLLCQVFSFKFLYQF